ncbi:MAG: hypothetical protein LQ339_003454 [Xanthoria mediterranea]|nr:MAG: hypothetical protein LQ339_003454 [Xanthoria mediterranea]
MASQSSRGNCDDDLQAYYSTALSYPAVQGHGFVSTQPWRERKFVEDSEASDETLETQELPERQTELDPDLPPEVLENQLHFASTRPIFDNHQLNYQSRFTSTPPYDLSFSRRPQAQPIEQSGAATQVSDPTQHEPNLQLQPIVRSTPALSARLDSQETQFSITASLVPRESPLNQRETVETVPISQPFRLNKYVSPSFF